MTCAARIMWVSACRSFGASALTSALRSVGAKRAILAERPSSGAGGAAAGAAALALGAAGVWAGGAEHPARAVINVNDMAMCFIEESSVNAGRGLQRRRLGAEPANGRFPHRVDGHVEQQIGLHRGHEPRRGSELLVELSWRPSGVADDEAYLRVGCRGECVPDE